MRTDLLSDDQRLLIRYGLHLACAEGICGRGIVSHVQLGTNKDDGNVGGMVFDFRIPLPWSVIVSDIGLILRVVQKVKVPWP